MKVCRKTATGKYSKSVLSYAKNISKKQKKKIKAITKMHITNYMGSITTLAFLGQIITLPPTPVQF
jgi:hypothetical protein